MNCAKPFKKIRKHKNFGYGEEMSSTTAQPLGSLQFYCGGESLLVGLPITFVVNQGVFAFLYFNE